MSDTNHLEPGSINYPRLFVQSAVVFLCLMAVIFGCASVGEMMTLQATVDWFALAWIGGLAALGISAIQFGIMWLAADSKRPRTVGQLTALNGGRDRNAG